MSWCLRLPREILCWAINSLILAFVMAFIVQAIITGVWLWNDPRAFLTPKSNFFLYAVLSLVGIYLLAGLIICIKLCFKACIHCRNHSRAERAEMGFGDPHPRRRPSRRKRRNRDNYELVDLYESESEIE